VTDAAASVIPAKAGIHKQTAIPLASGTHTNGADRRAHTHSVIPVKTGIHFVQWTPAFAGATIT
jgi:hypothetical protein